MQDDAGSPGSDGASPYQTDSAPAPPNANIFASFFEGPKRYEGRERVRIRRPTIPVQPV